MKNSNNNNIILGFNFLVLCIWFQFIQQIEHKLHKVTNSNNQPVVVALYYGLIDRITNELRTQSCKMYKPLTLMQKKMA